MSETRTPRPYPERSVPSTGHLARQADKESRLKRSVLHKGLPKDPVSWDDCGKCRTNECCLNCKGKWIVNPSMYNKLISKQQDKLLKNSNKKAIIESELSKFGLGGVEMAVKFLERKRKEKKIEEINMEITEIERKIDELELKKREEEDYTCLPPHGPAYTKEYVKKKLETEMNKIRNQRKSHWATDSENVLTRTAATKKKKKQKKQKKHKKKKINHTKKTLINKKKHKKKIKKSKRRRRSMSN